MSALVAFTRISLFVLVYGFLCIEATTDKHAGTTEKPTQAAECTSLTQQSCPFGEKVVGFLHNSTSHCLLELSHNDQHIVSNDSSLYCGFDNGDEERSNGTITWTSPTNQSIQTVQAPTSKLCVSTSLELDRSAIVATGIYTCTVRFPPDTVYELFVGVYHEPGPPCLSPFIEVQYNVTASDRQREYTGVGLSWTTTRRPLGEVHWVRENKIILPELIESSGYLAVNVPKHKVNATYEHLLIIPWELLGSLNQTYSIQLSRSVNVTPPEISIITMPPVPSALTYNSSSSMLSWTMGDSDRVSFIEKYQIEYAAFGSNCTSDGTHTREINSENETIEGVSMGRARLQLEYYDTNYTIRMRSSNFLHNSTWSSNHSIYTPSKAPSGPPQGLVLRATHSDNATVILKWEEVECSKRNGHITGYSLRYASPGGNWIIREVNNELVTMVTELMPSVNYSFEVAAVNKAGVGKYSSPTHYMYTVAATPAPSSPKIAVIVSIVAGLFAILLALMIVILIVCKIYRTHTRRKLDPEEEQEWPDYNSADMELEETIEEVEPVIEEFPEDVDACPGEYLILYVHVSSSSPFSIAWFHNNQNVITNSSIEMREDGTLSIPCLEDSHVGVYRMVASNGYGSSSCELKLTLSEDESSVGDACMSASTDCEPIMVSSFEEYVASHHSKNNEAFRMQFMSLNNFDEDSSEGASLENKHLNRYKNIYPYNRNCVTLKPISGYSEEQNTYINASYIQDLSQQTKFIATQAPLPSTVTDFWHLVWQERTAVIVMLTNLTEGHRVRCQQYWPTSGSQTYGPFSVHLDKEDKFADYVIRRITVFLTTTGSEPPFSVTHYQFTSWPDHHTPDHAAPLLSVRSRVLNKYKTASGHILVHCSSGVGRTGVFIALDLILEKAQKEGVVDVMGVVNKLRQQRMRMVQIVAQYIFVYDSILEALVCGDTQMQACNIRLALRRLRVIDKEEGKNGFEKQYQVLKRITPSQCEVGGTQLAGTCSTLNYSFASLASEQQRRGVSSGYLGGTFIDGFRHKRAFIITQGPSEDMRADFWKMVMKHKCGAVVMLSDKFECSQEVCSQYWPEEGAIIHGDISVELVSERTRDDVIIRIFSLIQMKTREMNLVTQFQILNWTPDGHCSNYRTVVSLLKDVVEVQMKTGNNPIVVHCCDPVGRSAMFCAVMSVIERCKMEGIIDIFQVVKAMRMKKHGAIQSVDQYSFLYDIILAYLDSMDTYANFR